MHIHLYDFIYDKKYEKAQYDYFNDNIIHALPLFGTKLFVIKLGPEGIIFFKCSPNVHVMGAQ